MLSPSMFAVPSGYAQIASIDNLLAQSASGVGGMDLIFGGMDRKAGFGLDDK
jgi:hypothetical protein